MARWLLIASGEKLTDLGRATMVAFESPGSGPSPDEAPRPGDLEDAALKLVDRSEIPAAKIDRLAVYLIPLEGAQRLDLDVRVVADVVSRGGLD